jgi:hypothetical protein
MAVGRITAEKAWFLRAAKATITHKRLSRELLRAAARPGRTAELTASEVRLMEAMFPDDELVANAMSAVVGAEEAERSGADALRARLDVRRGPPPQRPKEGPA